MNAVVLAVPFRFKRLRHELSGGIVRDVHCMSLFDRQRKRKWWKLIRVQATICAMAHLRDANEEEAILMDMIDVYMRAFGRESVVIPRPLALALCLENLCNTY